MADYDQPSDVTKRLRYFDNQFLLEQDFIDEQKYHIDRQRRHDRLLHASGVAEGLEVTKAERMQVAVAPGTAVDSQGRHILLTAQRVVNLTGDGTKRLYLRFRETETDVAEGEGVSGATRFKQEPEIFFPLEGTAVGADLVLLAEVTVSGGAIQTVTMGPRLYAGVHLPGGGQTLRSSADGTRAELAGNLSVSKSLQMLGGAIVPKVGSSANDGIMFPPSSAGGIGDGAFIRYFGIGDGGTMFQLGIDNDSNDILCLWQKGKDRLIIRDGDVSVVGKLTVQDALSAPSITVNNVDVAARLSALSTEKFDKAGGTITGDLSVSKSLKMTGGAITPTVGSSANSGIMFPYDPAGGTGDAAFIRYFRTGTGSDEGTMLQIGIDNDSDDVLCLWQKGKDRLVIRDGKVEISNALRVGNTPTNAAAQLTVKASGEFNGILKLETQAGAQVLHVENDGRVNAGQLTVYHSLEVKTDTFTVGGRQVVRTTNLEQLRIVRGSITKEGGNAHGGSYKVSRIDIGTYEVIFSPAFGAGDIPTVIASQAWPFLNLPPADVSANRVHFGGVKTTDNVVVLAANNERAFFKTGRVDGTAEDRHFHFIAIGW